MKASFIIAGVIIGFSLWIDVWGAGFNKPQADRILFIADSHGVGDFGRTMDAHFKSLPNVEVETYAVGGSAPHWWYPNLPYRKDGAWGKCSYFDPKSGIASKFGKCTKGRTPLLEKLLTLWPDPYGRHVTVVALGSNLVGGNPEFAEKSSAKFARMIMDHGNECIWIGPPVMPHFSAAQIEATYVSLRKVCDGKVDPKVHCALIDSRIHSVYPLRGGDKVHYFGKAAKNWADGVFREFLKWY